MPQEVDILEDDASIAAAFQRLLNSPSLAKVKLARWEFELACNAPLVYDEWGSFTWKQRRALRKIAYKLGVQK